MREYSLLAANVTSQKDPGGQFGFDDMTLPGSFLQGAFRFAPLVSPVLILPNTRRLLTMSAYVARNCILRHLLLLPMQSSFNLLAFLDFGNRYVLRRMVTHQLLLYFTSISA
jgi:hypothetical protein